MRYDAHTFEPEADRIDRHDRALDFAADQGGDVAPLTPDEMARLALIDPALARLIAQDAA
jgi:hypothetical protein